MIAAALSLLGGVAACAQPTPPAAPEEGGCAAHRAAFPALIGRSEAEVRTALGAMVGIRTIRAGGPNTPMTRDYRQDRATLLVENAVVSRIDCG